MTSFKYFILIIIMSPVAYSQYGSFGITDARSIGMGNTGNASSYGLLSVGKNPSLLPRCTSDSEAVSFSLPSVGAQAFTNTLSIDDVTFYFGFGKNSRRILSSEDKARLLAAFKNDGEAYLNASCNIISFAWMPSQSAGTIAFSVTDVLAGNLQIPRDLADLAINGNKPDRTYQFNNLSFQSWYLRYYTLSYGRQIVTFDKGAITNISAGVSVKLVHGYAYSKTKMVDSYLYTDDKYRLTGSLEAITRTAFSDNLGVNYNFDPISRSTDFKFQAFPKPAGSGMAFDIGFSILIDSGLTIGAAITDLGWLNWTGYAAEHRTFGNYMLDDVLNNDQLDSLTNAIDTQGKFVDKIESGQPTALRSGIACELHKMIAMPGELIIAADFNYGLNSYPSNKEKLRMAFGAMWLPGRYYPSISVGLTSDEVDALRLPVGLGYSTGFMDVFVSTLDIVSLLGSTTMQASMGISFIWKIF